MKKKTAIGIGGAIAVGAAAATLIFNPGGILGPTSEIHIDFKDDQVICQIDFSPMNEKLDVENLKHDLMPSGIPKDQEDLVLVKGPYLLMYNSEKHVPSWVAYRVEPSYTNTSPRKDQFNNFCEDPEIETEPHKEDYSGSGFDQGHMIPYNVSGGDRDNDGKLAGTVKEPESGGQFTDYDDIHDVFTVRQINMMSNMAPQRPAFNRNGLWRKAESFVQEDLAEDRNLTLWEIAGTIFSEEPGEFFFGDRTGFKIGVPSNFYKIIMFKPKELESPVVLALLFGHPDNSTGEIFDCLVSIDEIEDMTGIEFFTDPNYGVTDAMKAKNTIAFLEAFTDSETATEFANPKGCQ